MLAKSLLGLAGVVHANLPLREAAWQKKQDARSLDQSEKNFFRAFAPAFEHALGWTR
jgi:hypothetical protein